VVEHLRLKMPMKRCRKYAMRLVTVHCRETEIVMCLRVTVLIPKNQDTRPSKQILK